MAWWNHPEGSVTPTVTLRRLAAWLAGRGHGCDIGVYLHAKDPALVVAGMWHGRPSVERLDEMRTFIDTQHRSTYGPDLAITPARDSSLLLSTQMVAYVGAGMSDAQLDAFMDMGLGMTRALFSTVQERFPELVTWEED